jgi:hypothetical protein
MPGGTDSIYHSIDVGNAHIIMLSSEVFFYLGAHSAAMLPAQFAWLEADLQAVAARNANGHNVWVTVHFHRPQYCPPNDDNDDCGDDERGRPPETTGGYLRAEDRRLVDFRVLLQEAGAAIPRGSRAGRKVRKESSRPRRRLQPRQLPGER